MTKTQIKSEIQKVLDHVPEDLLPEILDFLRELQEKPTTKVQLTNHLRKILLEDKALLGKLAQ